MTAPVQAVAPGVHVEIRGMRLVNTSNARESWQARRKRERAQRADLAHALAKFTPPAPAWIVRITRIGPRRLDDDGATISAKHIRDGISAWLGVDDGDVSRVRFEVRQEITRERDEVPVRVGRFTLRRTVSVPRYAVRILVQHAPGKVTP